MTQQRVVLLGCGGHASNVLAAFEAIAEQTGNTNPVVGLVDDMEADPRRFHHRGIRQIGAIDDLPRLDVTHFVLAKGWPGPRRALLARIATFGLDPATVVHPSACLCTGVQIGEGTVVLAHAVVSTLVVIGRHAMIGSNATLGHDCVVGNFASIMPAATVSGDTQLGEACVIGTNATVLQGRKIGPGAIVGAGAVVLEDVPANVRAVGVPARWDSLEAKSDRGSLQPATKAVR